MDPRIRELLERQAAWQKARRDLPWPEKIRLVEQVRESMRVLRASKPWPVGNAQPDREEDAPAGDMKRD